MGRKARSLEKIHLITRNGAYNNKLDALFLAFNEHEKDTKVHLESFPCLGPEHEKEKTKLIPGVPFL